MLAKLKALSMGTRAAIGGGIVLLIGFAIYLIVTGFFDSQDSRVAEAHEAGGVEAVAEGQRRTLEQLGDANDAEDNLRLSGERSAARFNECLRGARTPAHCERYRPLDE